MSSPMSHPRAFLFLLALGALAKSNAAQGDFFSEAGVEHIAWPASVPVLEKGRMVAGDVTGDLLPDALGEGCAVGHEGLALLGHDHQQRAAQRVWVAVVAAVQ